MRMLAPPASMTQVQDILLTQDRQGRSLPVRVRREDLVHDQGVPAVRGWSGLGEATLAAYVHRGRLVRLSMLEPVRVQGLL
ncbi:MAG: hypothetical protein ACPHUK_02530 [Candidatus Poseidoniaceae archaeon]